MFIENKNTSFNMFGIFLSGVAILIGIDNLKIINMNISKLVNLD